LRIVKISVGGGFDWVTVSKGDTTVGVIYSEHISKASYYALCRSADTKEMLVRGDACWECCINVCVEMLRTVSEDSRVPVVWKSVNLHARDASFD